MKSGGADTTFYNLTVIIEQIANIILSFLNEIYIVNIECQYILSNCPSLVPRCDVCRNPVDTSYLLVLAFCYQKDKSEYLHEIVNYDVRI